jgi:hypothetical protein
MLIIDTRGNRTFAKFNKFYSSLFMYAVSCIRGMENMYVCCKIQNKSLYTEDRLFFLVKRSDCFHIILRYAFYHQIVHIIHPDGEEI